ncbi:MAG TPA: ATP-dependent DNA helicase [Streptosporangiaceae bacterium]|nr:ATP-dependent DNA helicase [Streptosporangiaceae bacterium]
MRQVTQAGSGPPGPAPGGRPRPRYSPVQLARLLGGTEPTAEQAAVIGAPPGPMAVIAGAGSGKSETMAARLVWLVANQLVRPERVLGLTFTRKAAAELGERVRARLDRLQRAGLAGTGAEELPGEPTVSTYHAYAGRLVTDHALRDGLEPSLRLITPAVSWQIAASVVAAYDGPMDAISWSPATVTAAVIDLAGELAEHLRDAGDVLGAGRWLDGQAAGLAGKVSALARKVIRCQRTREQMLPLVAAYHAAKAAREVIDYGDQMAIAARIASRHPEVGAGERGRYPVVLLDEYQDTSHAQLVLLRSLFGGGHPVTAVGDPCQSIYGWRGASAGNLRRFRSDFPAGRGRPAPVLMLSTSFRNTGAVLAAAGAIQAELRAAAPEVPLLAAPPGRAERGQVVCALLESTAAEAAWVAGQAAGLLGGEPGIAPDGNPWPDGRQDAVRPSDIAVLCRKRSQFPALRAALEARGIPVEVVGLGGLLTVPEVADIVATLRVLHDPTASDALARLLTSPRWRIGPADLVALGRRARALASMPAVPDGRPGGGSGTGGAGTGPAGPGAAGTGAAGTMQAGGAGTAAAGAGPGQDQPQDQPAGGGPGQRAGQLMTQAVTDLTRDTGSLVEALDDLDGPQAYSAAGYARLSALASELRLLRTHVARPLPDLVGEVERILGLDIEVAARPGADPASARADLDAFTDAAAAFAGDREEPTLGAFLAYLTAAESEEFGLEGGRVGETDSVKLATVHAAKGLQWPAVFVPGLADGKKSHVFPASPRVTTRWTENPRLLPFALRGDAADLPVLAGLENSQLADFTDACSARELGEERRLAYVAATRAAFWLACSGYWWGEGASRLGPSQFLTEVRLTCEAGDGTVAVWEPEPDEDAENPALAEPPTAIWPAELAADARATAVRAAAALVSEAMADLESQSRRSPARAAGAAVPAGADRADLDGAGQDGAGQDGTDPDGTDPDGYQELIDSWASEAELLLAERARRRSGGHAHVALPRQLPVSALVAVARDPGELAQQVRRPMPRPPAPHALRGTEFHRWLEERFGQPQLIDADELPGAADDPGAAEPDAELAELKARFAASEWAERQPAEVELPFETLVADRLVRGRIDAVFADAADGRYDVVDWKTGRPPGSEAERHAVAVQLAAYRLAWAELAGADVSDVRAAFYYVRYDQTVRPADLLDEAGLTALIDAIPSADDLAQRS